MKNLLLISSGLGYIKEFAGNDPARLNVLFIPTAGNLDDDVWWIDKDREVLANMGFQLTELDIEKAAMAELKRSLDRSDIVYVAGGNTFYLLRQLRATGFDELLIGYINRGGRYVGASAGAIVAGPDIEPVAPLDEPEKVTGLASTTSLGFVDVIPIPHASMKARAETIASITRHNTGTFQFVPLTDDQAIVVRGNTWSVVESKRSQLELDWMKRAGL